MNYDRSVLDSVFRSMMPGSADHETLGKGTKNERTVFMAPPTIPVDEQFDVDRFVNLEDEGEAA